jgi:hypothetical protein
MFSLTLADPVEIERNVAALGRQIHSHTIDAFTIALQWS